MATSSHRHPDFYFVSMPFTTVYSPSIGIGLLQAVLHNGGLLTQAHYANLQLFAMDIMSQQDYNFFSNSHCGEWLFTKAAFGKFDDNDMVYLLRICKEKRLDPSVAVPELKKLQDQIGLFVDLVAEEIVAAKPKIVGASSIFFQHVGSLAVLRKIKEISPEIVTVLGGSNCDYPMGLATHKNFPWVDYTIVGEGDTTILPFTELALKYRDNIPLSLLPPGVLGPEHRKTGYPDNSYLSLPTNLDVIPEPDYSDYYRDIKKYGLNLEDKVTLLAESSRGCWWSARDGGCNFCSLLTGQATYRVKSSQLVLQQLESLHKQWQPKGFSFTDRIVPERHVKELLPLLAEQYTQYPLFYESRVNKLNRKRAILFRKAGVLKVQLGIESLNDEILKIMNKGATVSENIQALKFLACENIHPLWNIIFDIPGETAEYYEESIRIIRMIIHLTPPMNLVKLEYRRGSSFTREIDDLQLHWRYSHLYPLDEQNLADIGYIFESDTMNNWIDNLGAMPTSYESYHAEIKQVVRLWRQLHKQEIKPALVAYTRGNCLLIYDSRPELIKDSVEQFTTTICLKKYELCETEADVLKACDNAPQAQAIFEQWPIRGREIVADLIAKKLLIKCDERLVGLALIDLRNKPN